MSVVLERAGVELPTQERDLSPEQIKELEELFIFVFFVLEKNRPIVEELVPLKFKERDGRLTDEEKKRLSDLEKIEGDYTKEIEDVKEEVRMITGSQQAPFTFIELARKAIGW